MTFYGRITIEVFDKKKYIINLIVTGFLVLIPETEYPVAASDSLIKEIRFEKISKNEEKIFFYLNGFYPPTIFKIEGNNLRVVCDFFNARVSKSVSHKIETSGSLIQRIRIGIHHSPQPKIRVVLNLFPNREYDVEQKFFMERNVFSVSIKTENFLK